MNSALKEIHLDENSFGNNGAQWILESITQNSVLQKISRWRFQLTNDETISKLQEKLGLNRILSEKNLRLMVCSLLYPKISHIRLRFDKMILQFLIYPMLFEMSD
jgi:hypothetical protein